VTGWARSTYSNNGSKWYNSDEFPDQGTTLTTRFSYNFEWNPNKARLNLGKHGVMF